MKALVQCSEHARKFIFFLEGRIDEHKRSFFRGRQQRTNGSIAIEVENRSTTTWENMLFARTIMEGNHWRSCLISTDPYHERRSVMMAREMGMDAAPSPTPTQRR